MTSGRVLVIDDEPSIGRALQQILADEGLETVVVNDAELAFKFLENERPALIFLDIWLPGIDGLEALGQIIAAAPKVPVVMISGHATIATAVEATKQGASHFLEKPLDLTVTVETVRRLISKQPESVTSSPSVSGTGNDYDKSDYDKSASVNEVDDNSAILQGEPLHGNRRLQDSKVILRQAVKINPLSFIFSDKVAAGRKISQRTLAGNALVYGQGLHTGRKTGLSLEPLPSGSGIHFAGVAGGSAVPALVSFVESTGFATTLKGSGVHVSTVEHLLSALRAFGITNLLIKCNDEVPAMDGSALDFYSLISETGVEEQDGDIWEVAIPQTIRVATSGERGEFIEIEPAEDFSVTYKLVYPPPLGIQEYSFTLSSPEQYLADIAPARTFGLVRDIGGLQRQGLAQGGRFDNFVLVGEDGPINVALRFPDEFVRHKILDVIGDLSLLGRPLRGRVTACMTGHSDNIALLRAIIDTLRLPSLTR